MRQFRISFTVKGEERMGTVLAVIMDNPGYSGNLKVEEVDVTGRISNLGDEAPRRRKGSSPTPEERHKWAMEYWPIVKEALGNKEMHYEQVGLIIEKATNKIKAASVTPILSELFKAGKVTRTGRGIYKVIQ